MSYEYRAVFSYPDSILGKTSDSYGPHRLKLEETYLDRCYRPEESYGWRSGTQARQVTDWVTLEK